MRRLLVWTAENFLATRFDREVKTTSACVLVVFSSSNVAFHERLNNLEDYIYMLC